MVGCISVNNYFRVRPIPGVSGYTDTDTRYWYMYEKNWYELVSVSHRYIGIGIGMDQSPRIGIGLESLHTDTDISVSVYRYRSNSKTDY